ncbi:hypothetical protein Ae168Ps1_6300c [Pseudonocardia sp. Ae168_Ps1]|nr:hypothetical protein Ae150APs1_6168 [Pseudonocardia sp. Ae150A_Ps1]OLL70334.1 hypothetical protein Ae168Ps1_6300c [Pseudonocardia sp. Ae168_Ps1]OLL70712.1 hypothetical protein Ae263Ps1_6126 [Pseudonocardia sp. Ae263_Ps1]OLL89055.1 hypothetical protein Ae356Ps1_6264 [Pseudonocardia sp. Ae356_Ps1]
MDDSGLDNRPPTRSFTHSRSRHAVPALISPNTRLAKAHWNIENRLH